VARLPITAVQREGLYSTPSRVFPEKATQTFLRGAPVVNNAGFVQEAAANPRAIVGFAEEPGKNGATDGLRANRCVPALPHVVFEGSIDTAAAIGTGAIAAADLFAPYGITKDANGIWYVDKQKVTVGTNTVLYIVELVDPVGTVNGRVRFVIASAVTFFQL
jgi:hypothetical protein